MDNFKKNVCLASIAAGSLIMVSLSVVNMEASIGTSGDVKKLIEKFEGKTANPATANEECAKALAEMNEKKYSQATKEYVLEELKCAKE